MEKSTKGYSLPYQIKADWAGFLILLSLFEILFILVAITFFMQQIPLWICGIIIGFLPLSWWFLLSTFGIKLTDDKITYKSLFSKNLEMPFSDIVSVKFAVGVDEPSARGYGFFRLVIKGNTGRKPLIINMKMLSARDLAILLDVLLTKNPSIETDKDVEKIREKKLKEVVMTALKLNIGQIFWILISIAIVSALLRLIFFKR